MPFSLFGRLILCFSILSLSFSQPNLAFDPVVAAMLEESRQTRWLDWIAALSGAVPVRVGETSGRILTRDSLTMFDGGQSPNAFAYLQSELEALGLARHYDIHTYAFPYDNRYPERNWKNLILTFPGSDPDLKNERVLLVAHLDSTSDHPDTLAPGADDNASGAAGLLEAAAVLRHYQFARTIHLIWFSGEEQSRRGSEYFVEDYAHWLPEITAVINLDMFAFDWDNDHCFEIHAGDMPESQEIAAYLQDVIKTYNLPLKYDLIDDDSAYAFSDHAPFWAEGVPAVMIFENFYFNGESGCGNIDRNNHYHQITDTLTYINAETGFSILQAAMAAAAHLAEPIGSCFPDQPHPGVVYSLSSLSLTWQPLPGADAYQIWGIIAGKWRLIGQTTATTWQDEWAIDTQPGDYQIIAVDSTCGCQSQPGLFFTP
jgi:leucyl aminopeptidase